MRVICHNQAEVNAALAAGNYPEIVGDAQIVISDNSRVTAYDNSQVTAYNSSRVTALDNSQVTASGSSQVTALGNSRVTAYDNSQVTAYNSSRVTALDNSQVTALDNSRVTAYNSSRVTASRFVAVTKLSISVRVTGGVQIVPTTPTNAAEWAGDYGATLEDGLLFVAKAVRQDGRSSKGTTYAVSELVEAEDWDGGKAECGGGLHFCATPRESRDRFDPEATRFFWCAVPAADIVFCADPLFPAKVKAPWCFVLAECDVDGNVLSR
jgi:hypothetical protein